MALGCSLFAVCSISSPVLADCTPDPTVANATTACIGTDTDGIIISTDGSTVATPTGATVSNSGGAAITVDIPSNTTSYYPTTTIAIDGTVSSSGGAGIAVTNGPLSGGAYFGGTTATITVSSGASINGNTGISVARNSGNAYQFARVDLDNSGTISGNNGPALVTTGAATTFGAIMNRAGGTIYGISGTVGMITNEGIIDGGGISAIDARTAYSIYPNGLNNSGMVTSGSSLATLANYDAGIINSGTISNSGSGSTVGGNYATITNNSGGLITSASGDTLSVTGHLTVDNSGAILNTGSGYALNSATLILNNHSGGTISGTNGAINASSNLYLTNNGTVSGNVFAGSSSSSTYSQSVVDNANGTIVGDLTFGSADDILYAAYSTGAGLAPGVTGAIDGGAGNDLLTVRLTTDTALSNIVPLPINFETLGIEAAQGITVTLQDGFSAPGTIQLSGSGTVDNQTVLNGSGTVVSARNYSYTPPNFTNSGTINSTSGASGGFAVDLNVSNAFSNSGTINSVTGGVNITPYSFDNAGTITAKETAVSAFVVGLPFTNSGTINSTDGIGLVLTGSNYGPDSAPISSGTIQGKVAGVQLSTHLINTGLIDADDQAVSLNYYGILDNRAGGVVTGNNGVAIAATYTSLFNASVLNAGTINGDVSFAPAFVSSYNNDNRFFALPGGVLNGNLTLGKGDSLITEITNTGPGTFAGITGTVSAFNSYLRYQVRNDASATLAPVTGFSSIGYQLHDDAALTLTGGSVLDQSLSFAGAGSVDLTADIAINDQPAIWITSFIAPGGYTGTPGAIGITSHGTITLSRTDPYSYPQAAVTLGAADNFTNAGTITVSDNSGATYNSISAISGGTVDNSGTISVANGNGVFDAQSITNSGTIIASGIAARHYYNGSITNSGTLESTGGAAIDTQSALNVDNLTGGTITGRTGIAIKGLGGTVRNSGTINGTVNLAYSPYGYSGAGGTYIATGGTLSGDLIFGSGNDRLYALNGQTGVSGAVDAGAGTDTFVSYYLANTTVDLSTPLPSTFEQQEVQSVGANTVVTLTSQTTALAGLAISGDGQIVNQADVTGQLTLSADPTVATDNTGILASFSNEGVLTGSLTGFAQHFANSGSMDTSGDFNYFQLHLQGHAQFNNDGIMTFGTSFFGPNSLNISTADSLSFNNSGTIAGALQINSSNSSGSAFTSATISNHGIIETLNITVADRTGSNSWSVDNNGVIETLGVFMNYGAIGDFAIHNSGILRTTGNGFGPEFQPFFASIYSAPSSALSFGGVENAQAISIANEANGLIEATGSNAAAILSRGPAISIDNAGTITGGSGTTYSYTYSAPSGPILFSYSLAGAIQSADGADSLRNTGTITGSIDLGAGDDIIENRGTLNSAVSLGDGNDRFVEGLSASFTGTADAGNGNDTLIFDIAGGGTLDASLYTQFINFENFGLTGQGTLTTQGTQPIQTLLLDGAAFDLASGSTLQTLGVVAITGTGGNDHIINQGAIIGDVRLGGGDDQFDFYLGSSVSGSIDGGAGIDRLGLYFDPAATAPTPIGFSLYSGFEQFALGSGIGSLTGNTTFDQIDVGGGRLIGLAGSTITSAQGINVASGATFGSAGTVNGNITVAGTLSPGASPGTMTINGDVTLAGGSTSLFEMTPTISDALVINGGLTIQSGATLDITGSRPLTPGVTYDLITASNGITGGFSTISKATTVLGFVRQTGNSVQLLGTLQLPDDANQQVATTNTYINSLLVSGTATQGVYAALPSLVDAGGYANTAALSTLDPEVYASASQIGIDNGLAISSTVRTLGEAHGGKRLGLFGVGQGFGIWHRLNGSQAAGVSGTSINSGGFLGGIGFASEDFFATAFVGRVYSDQGFNRLAAKTETKGTFVGGTIGFASRGFRASGSVIWDDSNANTRRTIYDASKASARYSLHSLTLDGHIGYGFDLGQSGWRFGPQVGLTHIDVKRGEVVETGAGAFSLDVVHRNTKTTFFDADLELTLASDKAVHPWLTAGWQHLIDGDPIFATSGFVGTGSQFTVAGVERAKDFAHIGAGVDWSVTKRLNLFANGQSAFGSGTGARSVTLGLRFGL